MHKIVVRCRAVQCCKNKITVQCIFNIQQYRTWPFIAVQPSRVRCSAGQCSALSMCYFQSFSFLEIDHGCFRVFCPYFIGKLPCTTFKLTFWSIIVRPTLGQIFPDNSCGLSTVCTSAVSMCQFQSCTNMCSVYSVYCTFIN